MNPWFVETYNSNIFSGDWVSVLGAVNEARPRFRQEHPNVFVSDSTHLFVCTRHLVLTAEDIE